MGPHWFHHTILAIVWILTCAVWFIPETVLSRRLRSPDDAQKADRGSKSVVIFCVNLGVALGWVSRYVFPAFDVEAKWEPMFAVGIVVWLAGIAFRLYSMRVLGRFFTSDVAISKGQHVIEAGPYRWIRHPSYLGGVIAVLGFGMTLNNWVSLLLAVCCMAAGYFYRIPIEEKALLNGLGDEYRQYMHRTWRLVPYVF